MIVSMMMIDDAKWCGDAQKVCCWKAKLVWILVFSFTVSKTRKFVSLKKNNLHFLNKINKKVTVSLFFFIYSSI